MAVDITVFRGSPEGKIVRGISHVENVTGDEVLVQVTHSGVCGTDYHYIRAGIVLGHEGIGIVKNVGPRVSFLKVSVTSFPFDIVSVLSIP